MAKDFLNDLELEALRLEQRGTGMPQIVEPLVRFAFLSEPVLL